MLNDYVFMIGRASQAGKGCDSVDKSKALPVQQSLGPLYFLGFVKSDDERPEEHLRRAVAEAVRQTARSGH
jgi:hypothetical protein